MLRPSLSALALVVAAPAFAGGIAEPTPAPVIVPVVEDDWTGFYAVAQVDLFADATISDDFATDFAEIEGHLIGVFAGYRYDLGRFVVGAEVDYMIGSPEVSVLNDTPVEEDMTLLRVGVEGGVNLGDALVYGTAGAAVLDIDAISTDYEGFFAGVGVGADANGSNLISLLKSPTLNPRHPTDV